MTAPATAIIGYDLDFARHIPNLTRRRRTAKSWFNDPAHRG